MRHNIFSSFIILLLVNAAYSDDKFQANISAEESNKLSEATRLRKIELSKEQGEYSGQKVGLNEGGGKLDSLISWNAGENHASVGIGHFIWYPVNKHGPYQESFPDLLLFFTENGIALPQWLQAEKTCPWSSRNEMLASKYAKGKKYLQLESLLRNTIPLQVEFMIQRLSRALPLMLDSINSTEKRNHISTQFNRVSHRNDGTISSHGVYVLLDYVNFKGEGTNEKERYNDQGWGLLQVLNGMNGSTADPLTEFVKSAKHTLDNRIQNSPQQRNEKQWRKGWFRRLDTYHDQRTRP